MIKKWIYYAGLMTVTGFSSLGFHNVGAEKNEWFHVSENEKLEVSVPSKEEIETKQVIVPFTGKTYTGFKQAVAYKESQGQYKLVNTFGYMGKYQFGMSALRAVGITNANLFLNSPLLQEKAFKALLAINKHELKREIDIYEGKVINGVKVTESGILASAHLLGANSVRSYLKSNGKKHKKDGFGTSIKTYMKKFGGYDTSGIIPNRNAKVNML